MAEPTQLQVGYAVERITEWHKARFQRATSQGAAMKLTEEVGELIGAIVSREADEPNQRGDIGSEAADVFIVLSVLCGRWWNIDLAAEIERKLAILTDPKSGHRSALVGDKPTPHINIQVTPPEVRTVFVPVPMEPGARLRA